MSNLQRDRMTQVLLLLETPCVSPEPFGAEELTPFFELLTVAQVHSLNPILYVPRLNIALEDFYRFGRLNAVTRFRQIVHD